MGRGHRVLPTLNIPVPQYHRPRRLVGCGAVGWRNGHGEAQAGQIAARSGRGAAMLVKTSETSEWRAHAPSSGKGRR